MKKITKKWLLRNNFVQDSDDNDIFIYIGERMECNKDAICIKKNVMDSSIGSLIDEEGMVITEMTTEMTTEDEIFDYPNKDNISYDASDYPFCITSSFGEFRFCVITHSSVHLDDEWIVLNTPQKISDLYRALFGKPIKFNDLIDKE